MSFPRPGTHALCRCRSFGEIETLGGEGDRLTSITVVHWPSGHQCRHEYVALRALLARIEAGQVGQAVDTPEPDVRRFGLDLL